MMAAAMNVKLCAAESIHDLVICRLSRQSGYAGGGDEVFLLCEKINKGQFFGVLFLGIKSVA